MKRWLWGALGTACGLALAAGCKEMPRPAAAPAQGRASGPSRKEQLLFAAATIALPPEGIAPGDLPEPGSRGAQLLVRYCTQCHALPSPTAHSATDWPSVARRMWLRMEWLPESLRVQVPTNAERYELLQYLTRNALQVSGATLPAGRGRETFALVCSRCHALPDPRVHSKADWPVVFARMERNMERMQVAPPTGPQTEEILSYLGAQAGGKAPGRAARDSSVQ